MIQAGVSSPWFFVGGHGRVSTGRHGDAAGLAMLLAVAAMAWFGGRLVALSNSVHPHRSDGTRAEPGRTHSRIRLWVRDAGGVWPRPIGRPAATLNVVASSACLGPTWRHATVDLATRLFQAVVKWLRAAARRLRQPLLAQFVVRVELRGVAYQS